MRRQGHRCHGYAQPRGRAAADAAPGAGPAPHCGRNASAGCGSEDLATELRPTAAARRSPPLPPPPVASLPRPSGASAVRPVSAVLSRPRRLEPSLRLQRNRLRAGLATAAETSELSLPSGTTQPSSAKQPLLSRLKAGLRPRTPNVSGRSPEFPAPRLQGEGGHAPRSHPGASPAPRFSLRHPPSLLAFCAATRHPACRWGTRPETQGGGGRVTDCLSLPEASLRERAGRLTDFGRGAAKGQEQDSGVIC